MGAAKISHDVTESDQGQTEKLTVVAWAEAATVRCVFIAIMCCMWRI